MQKKKLLMFHPALAPYGIDQFNFLNEHFDFEIVFLFEDVQYDKFNQQKLLSQLRCKYSFLLKGIRFGKDRILRFGMWKMIKKNQPDIVVGYEYSLTTLYLIFLKRLGLIRAKIGSTIDDSLSMCLHEKSGIHKFARQYSVKHLDYLILFSNEVANFYQQEFSVAKTNTIVFPVLQSEKRLKKEPEQIETIAARLVSEYHLEGKRALLYAGRLTEAKGLLQFIENMIPALREESDLVWVMVGNGNEYEAIKNKITENQLDDKILLPGRFEGNELYAWYLCASGFVLPSVFEPYGAVVNEALLFGLRVMCSCYAGSRELISPDNGVVFDPLNENETKAKLQNFISSIPAVNIHLSDKKSLMIQDCNHLFWKEWEKALLV